MGKLGEKVEVAGADGRCWAHLAGAEFPEKQQELGGPCSAALQLWLEYDAASRCQEAWAGLCFSEHCCVQKCSEFRMER